MENDVEREEDKELYFDVKEGAPILFHATSTLYLDMIRKNGVDKRNLIEEFHLKEMLIELEQACLKKEILVESYWETTVNMDFVFTENAKKIKEKWNDNQMIDMLNRILYQSIKDMKTKENLLGAFCFHTSLRKAVVGMIPSLPEKNQTNHQSTVGGFFYEVMRAYILYRQITGETYSFRKMECDDLVRKVYDQEKNCIGDWIEPVIIAVREIPWGVLKHVDGDDTDFFSAIKRKVKDGFILKEDYYEVVQATARYIGETIPPEKLEIVELKDMMERKDGEIDCKSLTKKLYDHFGMEYKECLG